MCGSPPCRPAGIPARRPRAPRWPRLAAFVNRVETRPPFPVKITPPVKAMFAAMAPDMAFPFRLLFGNLWLFGPLLKRVIPKVSGQAGALLHTTCAFTMAQGSDAPKSSRRRPA